MNDHSLPLPGSFAPLTNLDVAMMSQFLGQLRDRMLPLWTEWRCAADMFKSVDSKLSILAERAVSMMIAMGYTRDEAAAIIGQWKGFTPAF